LEDLIQKLKGIFFVHCSLSAVEDYILVDMGFVVPGLKAIIILQVILVGGVVFYVYRIFNRGARSKRRRYR
jgi:hypothetical protein